MPRLAKGWHRCRRVWVLPVPELPSAMTFKERDPWCTARRKCPKGPRLLASLVIRGSIGPVGARLNPELIHKKHIENNSLLDIGSIDS